MIHFAKNQIKNKAKKNLIFKISKNHLNVPVYLGDRIGTSLGTTDLLQLLDENKFHVHSQQTNDLIIEFPSGYDDAFQVRII